MFVRPLGLFVAICVGLSGCVEPWCDCSNLVLDQVDDIHLDGRELPLAVPLEILVFDLVMEQPARDVELRVSTGFGGVQLHLSGTDLDGADHVLTWTDERGVAAVELVVESLPVDDSGQPREAGVLLDIGVDAAVVAILP